MNALVDFVIRFRDVQRRNEDFDQRVHTSPPRGGDLPLEWRGPWADTGLGDALRGKAAFARE